MKNTIEVKVNPEMFEHTSMTEEMLFRELARKMVTEMPIDDLKKLIKFEVIDPFSNESKFMLYPDEIVFMREQNIVKYKAECNL